MLSSADTILGLDTGDFSDTQMEMFALIVATAFRREGVCLGNPNGNPRHRSLLKA